MEHERDARPLVLMINLARRLQRQELADCLHSSGFIPIAPDTLPPRERFGIVTEAYSVTLRERKLLELLPLHDHSREIAAALDRDERTIDDQLQDLAQKFSVHSRHRLLLKATEVGSLSLKAGPSRNRLSAQFAGHQLFMRADPPLPGLMAETSHRRSVLKVVTADTEDARRVEQSLMAAGFPVLRQISPLWEAQPGTAEHTLEITPRQWEVLQLLTEHDTSERIAAVLGVTRRTIIAHVSHLEQRLGVASRHRLVAMCLVLDILRVKPAP